jgi:hypothetical protein
MAERVRVGVLISGRGSNMVALAEHKRASRAAYDIVLVASNVPEARGLVAAKRLGIPVWAHSHTGHGAGGVRPAARRRAAPHDVELIALAGYMRLLSPEFVAPGRGGSSTSTPACCRSTRASTPTAGRSRRARSGRLLGPSRHRRARRRAGPRPGEDQDPRARRCPRCWPRGCSRRSISSIRSARRLFCRQSSWGRPNRDPDQDERVRRAGDADRGRSDDLFWA